MSKKDFYHEHVRNALLADGWTIVEDPFKLPFFNSNVKIDFGAERQEPDGSTTLIAVEVKNFRERKDYTNEFQKALGQYLLYRDLLTTNGFPHQLFLAVPHEVFKVFFRSADVNRVVASHQLNLLTFEPSTASLVQWKPHSATVN